MLGQVVKDSASKKQLGRQLHLVTSNVNTDEKPCVMVFACHPDDAEIGMGGTIAAMLAHGVRVIIVDLSDGEPTPFGSEAIRARETKHASKILGITERVLLGLTNREIQDTIESRKKVAAVIRQYKPTILFSHHALDAHPDHVAAASLVDGARFYAKFVKSDMPFEPHFPRKIIYYHAMHLKASITPSFVLDVSAHHATKLEAIAAYVSQFGQNKKNAEMFKRIEQSDGYWGGLIDVEFGEAFTVKEVLQVPSIQALLHV